ncbi:MAG: response regulator [Candidatus Competibacter denitrificans]
MTLSNEISSALEAEIAAVVDVLMEGLADPEAAGDVAVVADGLGRYGAHVSQIGVLAEQGGLVGLGQVCAQFHERLLALANQEGVWVDAHREALEEWPALIMGYLESGETDSSAGEALLEHLQRPIWSRSLPEADALRLQEWLIHPAAVDPIKEAVQAVSDDLAVVSVAGATQEEASAILEQALADEAIQPVPEDFPLSDSLNTIDAENVFSGRVEEDVLAPASASVVEVAAIGEATQPEITTFAVEPEVLAVGIPPIATLPSDGEHFQEITTAKPVETNPQVVKAASEPTEIDRPLSETESDLLDLTVDFMGMESESTASVETATAFTTESRAIEPVLASDEKIAPSLTGFNQAMEESIAAKGAEAVAAVSGFDLAAESAATIEDETDIEAVASEAKIEDETDIEAVAPEATIDDETELEAAGDLAGFDQELVDLLLAEAGSITETVEDMKVVAVDAGADADARSEALLACAEQIARLADASEALGLSGLQQACGFLNGNVMAFAGLPRPLAEREYDLIAAWPERAIHYLQTLPNRKASHALVEGFSDPIWPSPLPTEEVHALVELLATPTFAIPEAMAVEPRPREALPEHVSLALPGDVNPELLDSLLQELPSQTAELSAAIQRLAAGNGVLRDVEVAQRIAHTVKGAGNTVGVRGIANLTHHMEDILQAFSKHQTLPNRRLADTLLSAVDCLENMSEALVGLGDPPPQAQEVLQGILDWANQIDKQGLPKEDDVALPSTPKRPAMAASRLESVDHFATAEPSDTAEAAETVTAATGAQATVPMLRVPATLVDELLRLVGESIILTGQVQERTHKALRQMRAVQSQHQVFQQLTADLEQLVEIRGIAPFRDQVAAKGDFDPLELEQYNELNTVTHRLLEASADSRALGQDIRDDLSALDDLLVTQGRLHRQSQEAVLRTRMVPVKTIVPRLQRSVRQTCRLTDKEVKFLVIGDETMMDSNLLADITDPLMHILRNAVDHGIEAPEQREARGKDPVGRIDLSFVREGSTIVVRCRDDGAGLDFAAIRRVAQERGFIAPDATPGEAELSQIILTSGFSTRSEATQTSGRGVGLDAVHSRLRELKGSFQIRSEAGRGCLMELRLPVTLIAVHALLVRVHEQRFAISSRGVEQVLYSGLGEIHRLGEKTVYRMGDDFYEMTSLEAMLHLSHDRRGAERQTPALMLVRDATGVVRAVLTQEVLDSRDLVVKPLGRYFPKLRGIVGATILGDGSVVPVLDLPELLSAPLSQLEGAARREIKSAPVATAQTRQRMALVVDDSLSARRALAQAVSDAGFEVRMARDGLEAVSMIEARQPDLLLVDLEMPRMNGLELTAHVRGREATRTLPVIMVTSRSTAKHRQEAEKVGVNFYMTKPFTDDELLENVALALRTGVAVNG